MPPREVLVWLYVTRRFSDEQIGELCGGAGPKTAVRWRQELGIHRERQTGLPISKAVLEDLYVTQGLTIKQVGEKVGRSAWAVHQLLRQHKIPIRPPGCRAGSGRRRIPAGKLPNDP